MKKSPANRSASGKWELIQAPPVLAKQQGILVALPIPVKETRRVESGQLNHGELARWIHKYVESGEASPALVDSYKSTMAHLQLYQESVDLLNNQDFQAAFEKTSTLVNNFPQDTLAKLNLAHLLMQSGKAKEANDLLTDIQSAQSGSLRFLIIKARVLEALGNRQEAVGLLHSAFQQAPKNYSIIQELQRLGELIPVVFNADNLLESQFVTRAKYSQLVRENTAALLKARKFAELQRLADFHLEDRKPELAEFISQTILEKQPDSASAKTSLGIALMHQKKLEGAEKIFRELISTSPTNYKAHTCLARILFDFEKMDEAKGLLLKAFELDSEKTEAPELLILAQPGPEERMAKALELCQKYPNAWVPKKLLGDLEFGFGQVEEALAKHLEVFAKANSDDALTMILHEYDKLSRLDDALKLISETADLEKRNAAVRWNAANIYLKGGRLKPALAVLKNIVNDKSLPHETRFSSTVLLSEIYKNMK
ncbi:MAG: tetratricopeptide repeat protein [Candidatus Sumerlaeia bacterium]|nr:tetratricopeptide repeat protein [Candidatus Sumerlaeia bacterium]